MTLKSNPERELAIAKMARMLAEHCAELGDDRRCIIALQAAGFSDRAIVEDLDRARRQARGIRASEINRRYAAMWNRPNAKR